MKLIAELRRRNVFRVAVAYLVVAWVTLQVGALASDSLGFPGWFMPMLFVLLGLPSRRAGALSGLRARAAPLKGSLRRQTAPPKGRSP